MNNNEYRLMPVKLLPAVAEAIKRYNFMPDAVWGDIIAAFDRVSPTAPERSETPADDEPVAIVGGGFQLLYCRQDWSKGLNVGDHLYTRLAPTVSSSAAPSGLVAACRELIAYVDKNPPMADSLWCVQKIRTALAASTPESTALNSEELAKALRKAYNYGQTYWQQADSEYLSQQRKSNETADKFAAFVTETCTSLATPSVQGVAAAGQELTDLRSVLQEFVNYHTVPAGLTLETVRNQKEFSDFIHKTESKEKAMVAKALTLLSTNTPALPGEGAQ